MRNFKLLSLKMAIASTIAFIISIAIGLEFAISSAIVAILSIQDTKRSTIKIAIKRLIASIIGIALSVFIYTRLGQNLLGFFVFICIFSYIVFIKNIEEGLTVTVVLSTHLYLSNITLGWIINEFSILIIGIVVATTVNLFMPALEDTFNIEKVELEDTYKKILHSMSKCLITQTGDINEQKLFSTASNQVNKLKNISYKIYENRLIQGDYYYLSYSNMRENQFNSLIRMRRHFERFYTSYEQTGIIASFTKKVSDNIGEKSDCLYLIEELKEIREIMKCMQLPKTREEFENRALLYQYLNDLEEFIMIKHIFISQIL